MRLRDLTCAFCFAERSALRFDRKSRPYFTCAACGARSFLTSMREAVRHLALVEPLVRARAEQIGQDEDAAAKAAAHESGVAAAFRAVLAPSTSPAQVQAPPEQAAEVQRRNVR